MSINRKNFELVKAYLSYLRDISQLEENSIAAIKSWLKHYLIWADEQSFRRPQKISPHFLKYLETARINPENDAPLSESYRRKIREYGKVFFEWLKTYKKMKTIDPRWIETLSIRKTNRSPNPDDRVRSEDVVSYDEIMDFVSGPTSSIADLRTKASGAFLFLGGLRVTAFVTLPILAIDINNLSVKQWPELGVRTKNNKKATTFLFDIPELLIVVKEWDTLVRKKLPSTAPWYAPLSPKTGQIDPSNIGFNGNRGDTLRSSLERWAQKNDIPYHHPHKFRHGHAVYGLKLADDMADYKAVSQNLMHESIMTTDRIYSILVDANVKSRITSLGKFHRTQKICSDQITPESVEVRGHYYQNTTISADWFHL